MGTCTFISILMITIPSALPVPAPLNDLTINLNLDDSSKGGHSTQNSYTREQEEDTTIKCKEEDRSRMLTACPIGSYCDYSTNECVQSPWEEDGDDFDRKKEHGKKTGKKGKKGKKGKGKGKGKRKGKGKGKGKGGWSGEGWSSSEEEEDMTDNSNEVGKHCPPGYTRMERRPFGHSCVRTFGKDEVGKQCPPGYTRTERRPFGHSCGRTFGVDREEQTEEEEDITDNCNEVLEPCPPGTSCKITFNGYQCLPGFEEDGEELNKHVKQNIVEAKAKLCPGHRLCDEIDFEEEDVTGFEEDGEEPGCGTVHGPCMFPFEFDGGTYHGCTKVHHDQPWCATKEVHEGDWWGNCSKDCKIQN